MSPALKVNLARVILLAVVIGMMALLAMINRSCAPDRPAPSAAPPPEDCSANTPSAQGREPVAPQNPREAFVARLIATAMERTRRTKLYDPSYVRIDYPGGDVPDDRGVCADVIIRAYRGAGVDLQKEVHEDMARHFEAYPKLWGLSRPDTNIDHRRVPNLRTFFRRHGQTLPAGDKPADYAAGDLVVWQLPGNRLHIGLVIDRRSGDGARPLVVHNVGAGTRAEDVLTAWPIVDHFRYVVLAAAPQGR